MLSDLDARSRDIFKSLVDAYLASGEPVGSKTLSRLLDFSLSSATIRNVMSDLESAGLLASPHTSAGRVPTERGLKLFVDGFLEIGALENDERCAIETHCRTAGVNMETILAQASGMLSGLSKCAGVVIAPKTRAPLKHIEFVHLGADRALVVMVTADGAVENRLIKIPAGTLPFALIEATNYLNARLNGRTIEEARDEILAETASANTQKKFRNMCAYYKVPCILFGDKEQLGRAIGREYRSSLAVCEAHFAEKIAALLAEA